MSGTAGAGSLDDLPGCRRIEDDTERLRCYDRLAPTPEDGSQTAVTAPALEQRLQKERDLARRDLAILPYRPNYLLHTYQHRPNVAPFQAVEPDTDFQHQELKYQISLRVPIWNRMFGKNGDLWFGYTQKSYWQAYHWRRSSPFRETNYEPEVALTFHTDFDLLGLHHRLLTFGFAHQSNGRNEPLSRSWNRLWASFVLDRGNVVMALKPWYRIPEDERDDNPDIANYAGRIEWQLAYKNGKQVYTFNLRNNLRVPDNRSGYEIGWSFPIGKRIKGLAQFTNGFGDSLIDYNVRTRRVGIGVVVEDWL